MSIASGFSSVRLTDFNGDKKSDLFWFNRATGQTEIWLMDGIKIQQSASSLKIDNAQDWSNPIVADFDGDGKSDLFWRNSKSGENVIWLIDGTTVKQRTAIASLDSAWSVQVGDFNGDRKADLFWHNSSSNRENRIWLMDGTTRTQESLYKTALEWETTLADFNADGKSDIFFRERTTGKHAVWLMDGTTVTSGVYVRSQPISWSYEIVDYNGDGRSDIIWQDSISAQIIIWEWSPDGLNPTNLNLEFPSKGRDIQYLFADFGGDGRLDALVRNPSTGENQLFINEGGLLRTYNLSSLNSEWTPYAVDFNGNGKADLLWQNSGSGANLTWRLEDQKVVEVNVLPERSILQQWTPIV